MVKAKTTEAKKKVTKPKAEKKPEILFYSAVSFMAAEDYATALEVFDRLLTAHKDQVKLEWKENIVQAYLAIDQPRKALPFIEELSEKSRGNKKKQWQEVRLYQYMNLNMNLQALEYTRLLTREYPVEPKWWKAMAHLHLMENKYFLPHVSHTFHGRDIFAPVAAHLSRGADPLEMGPGITDPVPLEVPSPQQRGDIMTGQVMRVDHFGNLITNIQRKELEWFLESRRPVIRAGKLTVEGMSKSYGEALSGEALALIGSSDYLEIAVNLGRACDVTGMNPDDIIGMEIEVSRS